MPLLQCWPKSCTASPRQGAAAARWESCLGLDLSIDNVVAAPEVACLHPAGGTQDAPACHGLARLTVACSP